MSNDISLSRLLWSLVLVGVLLAIVEILKGAAPGTTGTTEQLAASSP